LENNLWCLFLFLEIGNQDMRWNAATCAEQLMWARKGGPFGDAFSASTVSAPEEGKQGLHSQPFSSSG